MSKLPTIKACNEPLAELGHKRQVFSNLKLGQAAVAAAEKKGKISKPSVATIKSAAIKATTNRESLLKAIEAATGPSAKADLYEKLSASLLEEMNKTTDLTQKTDLMRQRTRSERNLAYALLAERQLNPAAAKARRTMRLIE
jgi:hypothetical protein